MYHIILCVVRLENCPNCTVVTATFIVLQVRGVCQYGKLNYHLGAKGAAERRQSMYPDIDFCKNPGAICSDRRAPELRWVTGEPQLANFN
jgi:hypothetical protein